MGFPDFEIGADDDSYVSSQKIYTFLNEYAEHFQLRKYIQFNSYVIRVSKKINKWQVSIFGVSEVHKPLFKICVILSGTC